MSEEGRILELIYLYNNRKRSSMKPSPVSLFFLKEGANIARSLSIDGVKPEYKTVFLKIKHEWSVLDQEDKEIYIETSKRLEFNHKDNFNKLKEKKMDEIKSKMGILGIFN